MAHPLLLDPNTLCLDAICVQAGVIEFPVRTELDQIGAAGVVCTNTLIIGIPDVCPLDPKNPVISDYRIIISGIAKLTNCPRTFRNALICITGLLYEIALRFPDTVAASWKTDSSLKFCSQTFARILRREPQATFSEIPAITSAQPLCTGVRFIPSLSLTHMDLTAIPNMPDLTDITNLVGGAPINVH